MWMKNVLMILVIASLALSTGCFNKSVEDTNIDKNINQNEKVKVISGGSNLNNTDNAENEYNQDEFVEGGQNISDSISIEDNGSNQSNIELTTGGGSGGGSKSTVSSEEQSSDKETEGENEEDENYDIDCNVLLNSDINDICGKTTTSKAAETTGANVCSTVYESGSGVTLSVTYAKLGGSPAEQQQHCIENLNGEAIGEYACFAPSAGNSVYVYGPDYTVIITNVMPLEEYYLCNFDQLKQLGEIVVGRLY